MGNRRPASNIATADGLMGFYPVNAVMHNWFFGSTALGSNTWPLFDSNINVLRHVPSVYATIGEAMAASSYGDVVVVDEGEYSDDDPLTIPNGVGLRSKTCATVTIAGNIICQGNNTIRHVTLTGPTGDTVVTLTGKHYWFEQVTFVPQDDSYSVMNASGAGNIVMRRCSFYGESPNTSCISIISPDDYVEISSCWFDWRNAGDGTVSLGFSFDSSPITAVFDNNTLVNLSSPDGGLTVDNQAGWPGSISGNIFHATDSDPKLSAGANASNNVYFNCTSIAVGETGAITLTSISEFDFVDLDSNQLALRSNSKIKSASGFTPNPLLDFNGHPLQSSFGAFQYQGETSAIYRPRYDHDIVSSTAFDFKFNSYTTLENVNASEDLTYMSHDEIACHVNLVVGDIAHPSRATFYTTHDGYYRLVAHESNFDLTLAQDAVNVFGAFSAVNQTDTG